MARYIFALASLFIIWSTYAGAVVRITDDRGGRIGTYVDRYRDLRASGESVIIDGLCASACTILLGTIPRDKICVTSQAAFGFHAAWDMTGDGRQVTNLEATRFLYDSYPAPVKRWVADKGGLTPKMMFLRGKELTALYKPCYANAHAQQTQKPLRIVPIYHRQKR